MRIIYTFIIAIALSVNSFGQESFNFSVQLEPVIIPDLPGLHSYAIAQHNGKWLVIGGRKDGMHARQPVNSFPSSQNNTEIYVIDVNAQQFWQASLNTLPTGIYEQLQSTNMNFYQDNDTLYIIGGYGFSSTEDDHITYPNLTSVRVSEVINAVINETSFAPWFKQISDTLFAVTGGQLGKINHTFYLVGGHRFDGLYNPMGGPTFTQTYTNQIRKFTLQNDGAVPGFSDLTTITDPIHLRRRDYNLLPQIFPDGEQGYTISSGAFQPNADLPFLYPVDIKESGYWPVTEFNQYLSNYHSAKASLFDSTANSMHMLFFGGMSQYYYEDGNLIQDDQVPFVKTISRLTRYSDGTLQEYQLPVEMPGLQGASAEFIPNILLPHYDSEIIKLNQIKQDTFLIGHIYGGIVSPSLNPFMNNVTSTTSADPTIYRVKLIREMPEGVAIINGVNPFDLKVYPNPATSEIVLYFNMDRASNLYYYIAGIDGRIIQEGTLDPMQQGLNHSQKIELSEGINPQVLILTVVVDNKYYLIRKIIKN